MDNVHLSLSHLEYVAPIYRGSILTDIIAEQIELYWKTTRIGWDFE